MKRIDEKKRIPVIDWILALLLFLTMVLIWYSRNFGHVGMDEILFTLRMPMDGSGSGFVQSFIMQVIVPFLLSTVLFAWLRHRKREKFGQIERKRLGTLCAIWFSILLLSANYQLGVFRYIVGRVQQSEMIEQKYVDAADVTLQFPEKKRNLIWILMESAESSLQDKQNGGLFEVNYIPELTKIARENVSFSQSEQIEGAAVAPACGWTVAGMTAQFCGLPLKMYRYEDGLEGADNDMERCKTFLPGVTNLGDILENQGYQNVFMLGSDVRFGGRDKLMKQHGNYEIFDYYSAIKSEKIPPDYYVWWGYEDQKLYEYAKEKITELSRREDPFHLLCLTVDTHHVDGWICPLCENVYEDTYANAWNCASRQAADFLEWIKQQPFYDNTTIVITGDHCSMNPYFYKGYDYDKHKGETQRKVYNAIINPAVEPVQEQNRKFTTMDLFPTVLAALGVQIEGERLGLGTNLFSDVPTLAEEMGYEMLFDELNRKSLFYDEVLLYPAEK